MKSDNKKTPHSQKNPLKFNVTEPAPLMEFLMKKLDGISRSKVKRMLANKIVSVNDERTSQFDFALQPGMVVEIGKPTAKSVSTANGSKSFTRTNIFSSSTKGRSADKQSDTRARNGTKHTESVFYRHAATLPRPHNPSPRPRHFRPYAFRKGQESRPDV